MAQQVTAGLQPDVLVVLCTYLAHLEGGVYLAVYLVLLLRDFDVFLFARGEELVKVWVEVFSRRVEVAVFCKSLYVCVCVCECVCACACVCTCMVCVCICAI